MSPYTMGKAITQKIIVAPLHCKEKNAGLPSLAEFVTGTLEDKLEWMDGLIRGLGQSIKGKSNLHKEVFSYQLRRPLSTMEEITIALDTLLGVSVFKRDPVKSLWKAQVAVVALPDHLAATALKLGHVRIGWMNCRIHFPCFLPLCKLPNCL
ncbi:hypothetical protein TKK_0009958 [Trichogramma kaykai]